MKHIPATTRDSFDICSLCRALIPERDLLRVASELCVCPYCGGIYESP
jgi:hypothetical protein